MLVHDRDLESDRLCAAIGIRDIGRGTVRRGDEEIQECLLPLPKFSLVLLRLQGLFDFAMTFFGK